MSGFIAVHVGAGYHGDKIRPVYKKTCLKACKAAIQILQNGGDASTAVTEAVSILEDCPSTNAGIGSNLTINGTVECDASVMDGHSLRFGSVGALSNIKNPVKVALAVLEQQKKGLLSCGRVPPCTIVGQGAQDWSVEKGFLLTDSNYFITSSSKETFIRNLKLLQRYNSEKVNKCVDKGLLDTVGAVCVDSKGNVASAVSSGGILLKCPGRLGQAAVYGCGCWAQNSNDKDKPSVACSATGVGEYLIQTMLSSKCCQRMYDASDSLSTLPDMFKTQFLESPFLDGIEMKAAGILALKYYHAEKLCELAWVHNTKTMILGFMTTKNKPVAIVSMQPNGAIHGKSVVGSENCFRL